MKICELSPFEVKNLYKKYNFIGSGTYAEVYKKDDNHIIKFTKDDATLVLSQKLLEDKPIGFVQINKVEKFKKNKYKSKEIKDFVGFIEAEYLYPISEEQENQIQAIYDNALFKTSIDFGFKGKTIRGAHKFATKIAQDYESTYNFSVSILEHLQKSCLNKQYGKDFRGSIEWLKYFCESYQFDIDLIITSNWMLNKNSQLVFSDPVVAKAGAF